MAECSDVHHASKYIIWLTVTVAVGIIIFLSFLKRRVRLWPHQCYGLPGIVSPVNLISGTTHEWVYVVIFGALSITVAATIFQSQSLFILHFSFHNEFANVLAGVVSKLVWVTVLAVLYFPVFACVEAPIRWLGYITGLLYTAGLLTTMIFYVAAFGRGCTTDIKPGHYEVALGVLINVPGFICFIIVLVWYFVQLVRFLQFPNSKSWKECYPATRVSMLLKRPKLPVENDLIATYIYDFNPTFKFPLKFLAAVMVSLFVLWEGTVLFTAYIIAFVGSSPSEFRSFGYILVTAFMLSGFFTTGTLLQMVKSVRQDLQKASRGDCSVLPKDSSFRHGALSAAVSYPGYQIAFMFVAYVINAYLFFIPGLPVWIVASIIHADPKFAGYLVTKLSVVVAWASVTYFLKSYLFKHVFQTEESLKHKHGPLILTNRGLLNCFAYVLFFYNALAGFIPALLRLVFAVAPVAAKVMRLDQLLYWKSIAKHDAGYAQYIRFLYFETTVNNPVMHTFVYLLSHRVPPTGTQQGGPGATTLEIEDTRNPSHVSGSTTTQDRQYYYQCKSKQARNLWFLAYTLLKNPQLQSMRVRTAPEEDDNNYEVEEYEDLTHLMSQAKPHSDYRPMQVNYGAVTPEKVEVTYIESGETGRYSRNRNTSEMSSELMQYILNIDFDVIINKGLSLLCNLYTFIVLGAFALVVLYFVIAIATM